MNEKKIEVAELSQDELEIVQGGGFAWIDAQRTKSGKQSSSQNGINDLLDDPA